MARSSPHLIFREPDPTRRPYFVGRMPSQTAGRTLDVSYGFTPEGEMRQQTTDRGLIRDNEDPFFYLCVFGGTLEMTKDDMHECVEEMVYTRQRKSRENPREIADWKKIQQATADFLDALKDAQAGRKRFAT